jgi:mono/diheme cytochrome c family protein
VNLHPLRPSVPPRRTLVIASAVLWAAAGLAEPQAPAFTIKGDATKGQLIFKERCAGCHGDAGKGDGPVAAALVPRPANLAEPSAESKDDGFLFNVIKEGGPAVGRAKGMPPWKQALSDAEVMNVAAFVRSLAKPSGTTMGAAKK